MRCASASVIGAGSLSVACQLRSWTRGLWHRAIRSDSRVEAKWHNLVLRLVISKARIMDKRWPVQDAKARFSELLECAMAEGPQVVTKRGVETAVLLPIEQWQRLERMARPNLKELLLASEARTGDLTPARRPRPRRRPQVVE